MSLRILHAPWDTQPQEPVRAIAGGPLGLVYGGHYRGTDSLAWELVNTSTEVISPIGKARSFSRSASSALLAPVPNVSMTNITLFAVVRTRVISAVNQAIIGLGTSTSDRILLYLNTNKFAMFSGSPVATGQATLTTALTDTNAWFVVVGRVSSDTLREVWGSSPMSSTLFWETQSNTTSLSLANATAVAVAGYYSSGALVSTYYPDFDIAAAGFFPYALPDAGVHRLLANLSAWTAHLEPHRRWVLNVTPTFRAAYLRGSNSVINAGNAL